MRRSSQVQNEASLIGEVGGTYSYLSASKS